MNKTVKSLSLTLLSFFALAAAVPPEFVPGATILPRCEPYAYLTPNGVVVACYDVVRDCDENPGSWHNGECFDDYDESGGKHRCRCIYDETPEHGPYPRGTEQLCYHFWYEDPDGTAWGLDCWNHNCTEECTEVDFSSVGANAMDACPCS